MDKTYCYCSFTQLSFKLWGFNAARLHARISTFYLSQSHSAIRRTFRLHAHNPPHVCGTMFGNGNNPYPFNSPQLSTPNPMGRRFWIGGSKVLTIVSTPCSTFESRFSWFSRHFFMSSSSRFSALPRSK